MFREMFFFFKFVPTAFYVQFRVCVQKFGGVYGSNHVDVSAVSKLE
jgi:hypothetical protein